MTAGTELERAVLACLDEIVDPCSAASASPMSLVEMGVVGAVRIDEEEGTVDVDLRLTSPSCLMIAYMTKEARRRIGELPGVRSVEVHADSGLDWTPDLIAPDAGERRRAGLRSYRTALASDRTRTRP